MLMLPIPRDVLLLPLVLLLVLALLLSALLLPPQEPPTLAQAKVYLDHYRQDVDTVADYLMSLETDNAFISKQLNNDPGKVFYDFEWHDIASSDVKASVRHLWRAGCTIMEKDEASNTVSFMIWSRTAGQVDVTLAFTIDGEGEPKTEFQISHEAMGDGWFYCFDDYEEYRSHPSDYAQFQPNYNAQ